MLFAVVAGVVPLASLSDCGPRLQPQTILFWVELLRSILLFVCSCSFSFAWASDSFRI